MFRDNILPIVFSEFNLKASNWSLFITVTLHNEALETLFTLYMKHYMLWLKTKSELIFLFFIFLLNRTVWKLPVVI